MISTTTRLATLATLLLPLVSATLNFNTTAHGSQDDYSISPSWGISGPCATAYAADIPCDAGLLVDEEADLKNRGGICTNQCLDGLRKWRDNIREKCSTADVKAATSQLTYIGRTVIDSVGPTGAQVLASVAIPNLPVVEALYFMYCMRDLKTGEMCPSPEEPSVDVNITDKTTYCANNCFTQYKTFTSDVEAKLYGNDNNDEGQDFTGLDIHVLCPGIDTSNYPATLSQKSVSSYSFDSPSGSPSSPSSPSNTTSPAGNATDTSKPDSAASSLKGSLWGMGGIAAAIAIGMSVI